MPVSLFGGHWLHQNRIQELGDPWTFPWIEDGRSLTVKIKHCCTGEFRVNVLCHGFVDSPDYASTELNTEAGEPVLHREVLLCDNDTPLVFACSLLPEAALTGRFEELRDLGAKPLGHWIFQEPVLRRDCISVTSLRADNGIFGRYRANIPGSHSINGRKTLFSGAGKPLLVSEFFLPGLQNRSL